MFKTITREVKLSLGDLSTKNFHITLKIRSKKNRIFSITDSGGVSCSDLIGVEDVFGIIFKPPWVFSRQLKNDLCRVAVGRKLSNQVDKKSHEGSRPRRNAANNGMHEPFKSTLGLGLSKGQAKRRDLQALPATLWASTYNSNIA